MVAALVVGALALIGVGLVHWSLLSADEAHGPHRHAEATVAVASAVDGSAPVSARTDSSGFGHSHVHHAGPDLSGDAILVALPPRVGDHGRLLAVLAAGGAIAASAVLPSQLTVRGPPSTVLFAARSRFILNEICVSRC
ncbi:hypothetical protein LTT66_12430 [Nocardia gipuzkoensis]|uniref:hypothetical protein n=1 Tax=Nocardia gipuzkoensis TaxID=2749991 RepID=UPI001E56E2C4|nr:hypothetical protein [Nocardia gipuzkoensis]UGT70901.1 hypothetical protein LTT66_12430 [Nocardia gipuzkoensis]